MATKTTATPERHITDSAAIASPDSARQRNASRSSLTPEESIQQVRRRRAFKKFRHKSTTTSIGKKNGNINDENEEDNTWKYSRFHLNFDNETLEANFQLSNTELSIFECEVGMIIAFCFHIIVGIADIMISFEAAINSNNYGGLAMALGLCGGIMLVCGIQLSAVRAWAGKNVFWVKSFPSIVKARECK